MDALRKGREEVSRGPHSTSPAQHRKRGLPCGQRIGVHLLLLVQMRWTIYGLGEGDNVECERWRVL
jgi:hypothetical protein